MKKHGNNSTDKIDLGAADNTLPGLPAGIRPKLFQDNGFRATKV